ncbi:MAG: ABC transporter substrate-binding protein [Pseudorhodoplanes sp.]|uniref:ABC transporter substrate-binding protein n=1 Tax=Pseudorhodoplanes sp. TaxID=1934341 RepID=UPI003D11EDD3
MTKLGLTKLFAALVMTFGTMSAGAMTASAQGAKTLEVIVFPGGFNWTIFVGQDKGFFEKNGVTVKVTPTPNSQFQLKGLIEGKFDIAMTAMDNVIAYSEGQGAAKTEVEPDIFAFMGVDAGFLRLVAVPEVKTIADLKGKQVSVDALTTGYAFVLRKLLENGGLRHEDIQFVSAGGGRERFTALLEKKHAATLLISPFDVVAEAKGFNRLANADEALGHYQGVVGAARRSWAKQHEKELVGYITGYLSALQWLFDPANKSEAIAILRKHVPDMSEEAATRSYDILVHPTKGFSRDASLDVKGVQTVLQLRSGYTGKTLTDPSRYYDLGYYNKARKN